MFVPPGLSTETVHEFDLGRVAEYCPFCGQIRPFRVAELVTFGLLDFFIRKPPRLETIGRCDACRAELRFNRKSFSSYCTEPEVDLSRLVEQTNPTAEIDYLNRSARLRRIIEGSAARSERLDMIGEAFDWLDLRVARRLRYARPSLDRFGILAILCAPLILFFGILVLALLQSLRLGIKALQPIMAVALLAPFVALFWALLTSSGRSVRRKSVPEVADLLRPLAPTYDEIVEVHERLSREGYGIAKVVRPDDIWTPLAQVTEDVVPIEYHDFAGPNDPTQ